MAENKGYIINADDKGSVNISDEVVAIIAAVAATEVEGVHGLFISHGKEVTRVQGKRGLSKGIKVFIEGNEVSIDVNVMTDMGCSVHEVGAQVQSAIITAVEDAVGIKVGMVNVNICGISLS